MKESEREHRHDKVQPVVNEPARPIQVDCPAPEVWTALAAGASTSEWDPRPPAKLLLHAAECDHCGPLLRDATEIFQEEPRRASSWPVWAAIAAAVALVAAGLAIWKLRQPPLAELAEVYGRHRTMEIRLPGAPHGPIRIERGGAAASSELLDAAAKIARQRESGARSADWAQAQGRLAVVQGDYDGAIAAFQGAMDLGEPGADLLVDFAAAYFGRAESSKDPSAYTRSLELLGRALQRDANHRVALFNRGVVHEKLALWSAAIEDWDRFLVLEPTGGWAEEARKRREAARQRLGALLAPERDERARRHIEERLEHLLRNADQLAGREAEADARELTSVHRDRWLLELREAPAPQPARTALAKLASVRATIAANRYADLEAEREAAARAALAPAWAAWREFEELYRLSHTTPERGCREQAARAVGAARSRGYRWLLVQSLLERSTCEVVAGELDAADTSTDEARRVAAEHGLIVAATRGAGFETSHRVNQGRYRDAIQLALATIAAIEREGLPRLRLQQFYNDIMRASDRMERWHSATAAAVMCARIAASIGATGVEQLVTSAASEFSLKSGDVAGAERLFARARELDSHNFGARGWTGPRLFAAVALAEARNDRTAMSALDAPLREAANPFWRIPFLVSAAALDRRHGAVVDAERRVGEALDWLGRNPDDAPRWRSTLERASRLRVLLLLDRGRSREALEAWDEYLRQENLQVGVTPGSGAPSSSAGMEITVVRLEDRYALWWREAGAVRFEWLKPAAAEVERMARELRRLCSDPSSRIAELESISARIGRAFPDSLGLDLERSRAVEVRLDAPLAPLPLAALRIGGGEALGLLKPLVIRTARRSPDTPGPARRALVVVTSGIAPELRARYRALPGIEEEARTIAGLLPDVRILAGGDANSPEVERAAGGFDVFHFAGHSMVTDTGVALMLAEEDGRKSGAWRVPPGWTAPRLVFLAACATAEHEELDTVAPRHLAHAFLRAGARLVVAAQWNVDSRATGELVRGFYAGLARGGDAAGSLREAVVQLRASGFAHPYYWAPFAVYS